MSTVDTTTGHGPSPTRTQRGTGPTAGRPGARPRGRLANLARDTSIVLVRELRPLLHDPFSVVFGLVQPLVFLALFGPLLVGTLSGQDGGADGTLGGSVWQWFVPSILVMTTLFGTSTTGANLLVELQTGAHERMLVAPLSRASLLVGRALKEMVPIVAQSVVATIARIPTTSPTAAVAPAATQPHATAVAPRSPANSARSASTTYFSGFTDAATCIHRGPESSGSSIPDRSMSGKSSVCWTIQNIQSCLRTASASA